MEGSGGSNWSFDEKTNHGVNGRLTTTEFETQSFYSSTSEAATSSSYCPYSLRESQLSTEYQFDVLLVYDPEENSYFVDKLMEYLTPQNLKIFDFTRDAPPGLPQRKVLQSALQVCRYTCIVITKKFITNFWLQLRTDMSIQDMLDNEEKLYSVIVVVMDAAVKKVDLPLDLATLSPLFFSEKFFENRVKLAFSKTTPFPSLRNSMEPRKSPDSPRPSKKNYEEAPTVLFDSGKADTKHSTSKASIIGASIQSQTTSRLPREHGDGTFVMPPSIFSSSSMASFQSSSVMYRTNSVTVSSTGSREPKETSDSTSVDTERVSSLSTLIDEESSPKITSDFVTTHENSSLFPTSGESISTEILGSMQSYKESNFSCLGPNRSPSLLLQECYSEHEIEKPAFFSLAEPSFSDTTNSSFSELEISDASLPTFSSQINSINLKSNTLEEASCSSLPTQLNGHRAPQSLNTEISEASCSAGLQAFPSHSQMNDVNSKSNRLNNSATSDPLDEGSCLSLPAQLNSHRVSQSLNKSWSMRSLVQSKLASMSRTLSFRHKKK